jgi:hypothetical protein
MGFVGGCCGPAAALTRWRRVQGSEGLWIDSWDRVYEGGLGLGQAQCL